MKISNCETILLNLQTVRICVCHDDQSPISIESKCSFLSLAGSITFAFSDARNIILSRCSFSLSLFYTFTFSFTFLHFSDASAITITFLALDIKFYADARFHFHFSHFHLLFHFFKMLARSHLHFLMLGI